jgi:hypothetical protein
VGLIAFIASRKNRSAGAGDGAIVRRGFLAPEGFIFRGILDPGRPCHVRTIMLSPSLLIQLICSALNECGSNIFSMLGLLVRWQLGLAASAVDLAHS